MISVVVANPLHYIIGGFYFGTLGNATAYSILPISDGGLKYFFINMSTNAAPSDIAKEVICDTEAIIQILHTGTGLEDGFTTKNEIFETCLDTLVILSVIQLLLKRLDSSLEITKRIWATFAWINIYLHENEVFQDIDYASIIDKAQHKITLFISNILSAAKEEQNEHILIPDLSEDEQAELLSNFLNVKNGVIIQLEK